MLVLIYKRSGSKLLFPAVYSEKEMDEKMLVAKTDELTGAGILKADGDRFLLTEPYISFIDGITQAELFASASVPSGETPPLFAYFARRKSSALRRCRPVRVSSGYAKKTVTGGLRSCPRGSE